MTTTVAEMLRRFQAVDLEQEAINVVREAPEVLEDYNRKQLKRGRGNDGNYLLRYVDDPFFQGNVAWALGYSKWKDSLGRSDPDKPSGYADFFINGYTHHYLTAKVVGKDLVMGSEVPWGKDIEDKTMGRAFGLAPDSKADYRNEYLLPEIAKSIKAKTGAK